MHQRIDLNPLLDPHNDTEDVILYVSGYVFISSAPSVSEGNRSVGRCEELNRGSQGFITSQFEQNNWYVNLLNREKSNSYMESSR